MMNIQGIMKQAQAMQKRMEEMQEKLAQEEVNGSSGGGMVSLTMNGKFEVKKLNIDTSLVNADEKDILEAKVFDDYIVKNAYFNFDVHNITGAGLDKTGVQKHFRQTKGYTIPYRCLIPEVKKNLLLCGRNISGTHMAHSNFRVMPICVGIGEAAGTAAYISVKKNIPLTYVTAEEIRKIIGI